MQRGTSGWLQVPRLRNVDGEGPQTDRRAVPGQDVRVFAVERTVRALRFESGEI